MPNQRFSDIHDISIFQKTTLPNGVRILTEEVPTVASFSLGIWIDVGSRDESAAEQGIAHFIEHTAFRGTSKHTSRQIANMFESFGAYLNAFTTKEHTCFYVRALVPHFEKSLSLLAETVLEPAFRPTDVEKERTIILEEIKSLEDEPEELLLDLLDESMFGSHPLAHSISGSIESVQILAVEDLGKFHRENYHAGNIVIAVAGNVSHKRVVKAVEKSCAKIASIPKVERKLPTILAAESMKIEKQVQQVHIALGKLIPEPTQQERYIFAVLNTLLGDGISSRLNQTIREKRGIAYSVYSSFSTLKDCGIMMLYAALEQKNLAKTEHLLGVEIEKLCSQQVGTGELRRAKEQVKSSLVMSLESMSGRMNALAPTELYFGRREDPQELLEAVENVSAEAILALSQRFLTWGAWQKVVLLPSEE